uniref:protein FAM83H n=1 Tax=Jaculus jaculus TaxID=51337 RepID=UPI001E1B4DBB|nr:protein FAM83H [Jaculus jaculus]XP_044998786.1 protein FAM83H [Jaculus jaculus]XP_044998787.1 protein FAM83H [Jaculus jaculus]XP_044998788.1 protein FAM83H [Jaculus jaculus]
MARRSQSSSQGDNPLAPGYLPPHYKEYYRLAVDALTEGGPEAYSRFLQAEGAPDFLCPEELEHVSRHLQPPQHVAREPREGSPPPVDMDGSSGTYWPVNSDQAVPELDLGWPLTFGFQGTEVTTLVQPPPPDSPSIKDEARRMIRSAQQVVAVVMDMFTDVDLLSEVLEAAARRVPVYILLDEMNAQHFLDMADKCRINLHHVDFLRVRTVAGPTYYCRTGKSFKGHVKEKFLLVDCAVVMSGSYSFMWSFEKIHRSLAHVFQGELVSSFDEEFRILFAQSEPLVPSAGALARMDAYALAPYSGAGPLAGIPGGGAPPPFSFPKRAHLLFPPPREEGLGFPSFLDPDRHFLSAFRREELSRMPGGTLEPHAGLRSLRAAEGPGPGGEFAGPRGFFQARHLEMDAFKRHSYGADGAGAVENFAAARQVSRQTFLSHGDDFRFQTSHFHRDQLYQQHYQWDPQFAPARPQGLFEKLRAGRPGFADPDDFALGAGPRFPELVADGHQRLEYVPSSASREVRHGSDPAFGAGARGPEPSGALRANLGQRFSCQAVAKQGLDTAPEAEAERRGGTEGRAGLRHWRLASYLSGCHGDDGGEEGLPMEAEAYEDDVLASGGRDLLPSAFRTPAALPAKGPMPGSGSGGGDSSEREGPEEMGLLKQDSFRSRLNPLIQRSSRLRSSLIFASQAEGVSGASAATTEKVQLLHKEQTVSETLGPSGDAVRSTASAKVAELLEKYKGPARDPGGAAGTVTVSSHSKAVVSQAWREEVTAPGGKGTERRSLESCLLDLRDSFAQRLHQEAERHPGAASLTAAQLLDTLGRSGTDRLPSRFLTTQGCSMSPQGRDSPPPEGSGAHQVPNSEPKGSPTSTYPERKGSPTPGLPNRRSSPTTGFTEPKGSPTSPYPDRRGSPVPPVPERRSSPVPPVPERRGSLTFSGEPPKTGSAEEVAVGPMEVLRKGSLRIRQLLSPKSERRGEDEGGFPVPQENGQPESPRRASLGRGDSAEAAAADDRGPRARLASATANALYSSNLRDDTKAILEQISAHGQKHRVVPAPGPPHSSPELSRPTVAGDLAPDMSDKDKCSAIFRSDSLGTQGRLSRTLPASAEERDRLLRRMESMRKEKRVYSRFEVFCKKEEAGGNGAGESLAEEDTRDSKIGKFMPKILGTFKGKK